MFTAFYFQNFRDYLPLKRGDNGELVADWPMTWTDGPIPAFDVDEVGEITLLFPTILHFLRHE